MTKKTKSKRSKRANLTHEADPAGDLPSRRKCSIETLSVRIPRTTQQVTLRQVEELTDITASATANVTQAYAFALANLDNITALSSIWDQYKIEAIRFSILPDNNALGLVTNSSTGLKQLYCVIDYDDANTLASAQAAKKYDNCAIVEPSESICRTFRPRIAMAAYSGAFTSFANLDAQWIDMASTGVQHYGVKVFVPQATVSQTELQSWHVIVEYFVSFRAVF